MFGVVLDYYRSKLKGKQYKQSISPKIIKLKSKFPAPIDGHFPSSIRPKWHSSMIVFFLESLALCRSLHNRVEGGVSCADSLGTNEP